MIRIRMMYIFTQAESESDYLELYSLVKRTSYLDNDQEINDERIEKYLHV